MGVLTVKIGCCHRPTYPAIVAHPPPPPTFREDKGPEDATNATQIAQMYNDQACTKDKVDDDEFDD